MSGYPDGCTQHDHDRAFNAPPGPSADLLNAIVREVESRAEDEIRTAHQTFVDWLADYGTPVELARMLAFYKTGDFAECRVILDDVTARYQQYRTATLDASEQAEIVREL